MEEGQCLGLKKDNVLALKKDSVLFLKKVNECLGFETGLVLVMNGSMVFCVGGLLWASQLPAWEGGASKDNHLLPPRI